MTRKDKITLTTLCAGHFVNDGYSSIIFPLLPLLKDSLHLTAAQVFWLAPIYAVSSSLMQPVYGIISDRYARRFFAVFGPMITGLFVSMIGLAPSYAVLVCLLMAGGIGIGSFHPQGAAMAAVASGERRRVGMAVFSAMGTVGYSVGPLAIALLIGQFGMGKSYYAVVFGIAVSIVLYRFCPPLERHLPKMDSAGNRIKSHLLQDLQAVWRPLTILYLITVLRSGLQITTNNYLPFLLRERGYQVTQVGAVLTVFLLLGGIGGLVGGFMAEKISGRAVTLYSGFLAGPLMIAAFATSGPLSIVLLGIGGFALLSTFPVNVAMAQELVPGQTSTVSALMMGAAWGIGALAPPLLDGFVTTLGFRMVLILFSGATMLTGMLAFMLPRDENRSRSLQTELVPAAVGD